MNDFTKTELIEIKRCVQYMIKGGVTPYSGLTIEINKKLRIMYENYCEHEPEPYPAEICCVKCQKTLI